MHPLLFIVVAFLSAGGPLFAGSADLEPEPQKPPFPTLTPVITGTVANLFVHPLLAFPEKAFLPGRDQSRMDEWFVTVEEFRKALESLEERGFILVRPSDVFETGPDGPSLKLVDVPAGRKPLILSIDDLNYYPYMRANGTVSRLVVDDEGRLAARTATGPTTFRDDYDREVPQVLEDFIQEHPDFSYQGARGMIALTGYDGILGWPTHLAPGPELTEAQDGARKVVATLKALGWEFASHSYSHRSQAHQSFEQWLITEARWKAEVEPLVGPTALYVFPFGEAWWKDPDRWKALKAAGFQVFFGVEKTSNIQWKDGLPIAGRVPLDGRGLRHKFSILNPFLDPSTIWDPLRPSQVTY
jgi:hypothetical protein